MLDARFSRFRYRWIVLAEVFDLSIDIGHRCQVQAMHGVEESIIDSPVHTQDLHLSTLINNIHFRQETYGNGNHRDPNFIATFVKHWFDMSHTLE